MIRWWIAGHRRHDEAEFVAVLPARERGLVRDLGAVPLASIEAARRERRIVDGHADEVAAALAQPVEGILAERVNSQLRRVGGW